MRTSTKPTSSAEPFTRIVRPSGIRPIQGCICQDQPIAFWIHRWRKRTVPCDGQPCLKCMSELPTETRIFLPFLSWQSSQVELIDLPMSHWSTLKSAEERWGSLRDLAFKAQREKPRDNAPIVLRVRESHPEERKYHSTIDPVPLVIAITASNNEFCVQELLAAKMAATESTESGDR